MKTVYKIVKKTGDEFFSWIMSGDGLRLSYKVGEITTPKLEGSLLFVFDDLKSALAYCPNQTEFAVLECQTEETFPISSIMYPWCVDWSTARDFWDHTALRGPLTVNIEDVFGDTCCVVCGVFGCKFLMVNGVVTGPNPANFSYE